VTSAGWVDRPRKYAGAKSEAIVREYLDSADPVTAWKVKGALLAIAQGTAGSDPQYLIYPAFGRPDEWLVMITLNVAVQVRVVAEYPDYFRVIAIG
jgi:hypothetical protein